MKIKIMLNMSNALYIVGLVAGRFLLRSRVPKPKEDQQEGSDTIFYSSEDLFLGAIVK